MKHFQALKHLATPFTSIVSVPVGSLSSIAPSLLDPDIPDYSQLHVMTTFEGGKDRSKPARLLCFLIHVSCSSRDAVWLQVQAQSTYSVIRAKAGGSDGLE